jgi:hypothetical protein
MRKRILHVLWNFPYARDVWVLTTPRLPKSTSTDEDFCYLGRSLFWRLDIDDREWWLAITWSLWSARNKYIFDGILTPPTKVVVVGTNLWKAFAWFYVV